MESGNTTFQTKSHRMMPGEGWKLKPRINMNHIIIVIELIASIISVCFFLNRIRYGIDYTDEGWYVAEPYIVSEGAIPYINNWSQAPGSTMPLALFFRIFTAITGGTEGIFLFSRILYAVFLIGISFSAAILFFLKTKNPIAFSIIPPLLFITPYSLFDINYNTIGICYLFIASVLFLYDGLDKNEKISLLTIASGFLMARGIIGTPSIFSSWFFMVVLCFLYKNWLKLESFILGSGIAAIIAVAWLSIRGGFLNIFKGITIILTKLGYFGIISNNQSVKKTAILLLFMLPVCTVLIKWACGDKLLRAIRYVGNSAKCLIGLILFLPIAIFAVRYRYLSSALYQCIDKFIYCVLLELVIALVIRLLEKVIKNDRAVLSYILLICLFLLLILGTVADIEHFPKTYQIGFFIPAMILISGRYDETKKENLVHILCVNICFLFAYVLMGFSNLSGFVSREYYFLIPTILGIFSIVFVDIKKRFFYIIPLLLLFVYARVLADASYEYVYRDSAIDRLTEKIPSGVWKGMYTSPERADSVVRLEEYLRSITDKEDDVLFLDQVCFAYTMVESTACTPNTADVMIYSYRSMREDDNPQIMFDYFDTLGREPSKIIYIDFGRDEILSIDNEWEFNEFVESNYDYGGEYESNPGEQRGNCNFFVKWFKRKKV